MRILGIWTRPTPCLFPEVLENRFWENSQTNQLLQSMENFKGILFCCTNFVGLMDKATLRRFAWKIKFDYLTNGSKIDIFERSCKVKLTEKEKERLNDIQNLTVGDFKVARQQWYFSATVIPKK